MLRLDLSRSRLLLLASARFLKTLVSLLNTALQYLVASHRPSQSLAAENFFLRKQLALFRLDLALLNGAIVSTSGGPSTHLDHTVNRAG